MAFHVFVEGATDATPAGVERLANAIAQHYGLPAADLIARLRKGRFRVKGNTDRTTAAQYCRDLEILGARCVIEEATPDNSQRSTPLPFPAVRPATPVAGAPVVRPATPVIPDVGRAPTLPVSSADVARAPTVPVTAADIARARTQSVTSPEVARAPTLAVGGPDVGRAPTLPVRPSTPPGGAPQYASGLAAAFSGETPSAGLGALEQDGAAFSLSSVDGEEQGPSASAFEPPPEPAKPKPKVEKGKPEPAKPAKPKDEPLDMFAPPDAQGEEFKVELAADEVSHSAKKRASTPPPAESEPSQSSRAQSEPSARKSQPSIQPATEVAAPRSKLGPLGDERVRFAAGVVLAILIGLVPAHLVAAMREESAFKEIDTKVMAAQQLADTPDAYATLDSMRADQLRKKQDERRNATLIAFAIWGLVGAGVAFAWFKKIPWENFE